MLINSAQCLGFYSHPWLLLMDIDSNLSAPEIRMEKSNDICGV